MTNTPKRPDKTPPKPGNGANQFSINHAERRLIPRPFPSSEVIEGSESADWALWEEAVASQSESQTTIPAKIEEEMPDPFASVRKQRGAL